MESKKKKKDTNELIYKTEIVTYVENKLTVTSGKDGEKHKLGYWEYPTLLPIYTLQCIK